MSISKKQIIETIEELARQVMQQNGHETTYKLTLPAEIQSTLVDEETFTLRNPPGFANITVEYVRAGKTFECWYFPDNDLSHNTQVALGLNNADEIDRSAPRLKAEDFRPAKIRKPTIQVRDPRGYRALRRER